MDRFAAEASLPFAMLVRYHSFLDFHHPPPAPYHPLFVLVERRWVVVVA